MGPLSPYNVTLVSMYFPVNIPASVSSIKKSVSIIIAMQANFVHL